MICPRFCGPKVEGRSPRPAEKATGTDPKLGEEVSGSVVGKMLSNGVQADQLLQALESRGVVRRLAEPNLVTLSGDTASFLAGGEFPIPVSSNLGSISVEFGL